MYILYFFVNTIDKRHKPMKLFGMRYWDNLLYKGTEWTQYTHTTMTLKMPKSHCCTASVSLVLSLPRPLVIITSTNIFMYKIFLCIVTAHVSFLCQQFYEMPNHDFHPKITVLFYVAVLVFPTLERYAKLITQSYIPSVFQPCFISLH